MCKLQSGVHCLFCGCHLVMDVHAAIFRDIGFSDFIHHPGIKKQTKEKHDVSETGSVSVLRCGKILVCWVP
jgi:hypothetical protein